MKHEMAFAIAATAAAAAMTFAAGNARADDITADTSAQSGAATSSTSSTNVKSATQWNYQGTAQQVPSSLTRQEVQAAYIKDRKDVNAMYAEDNNNYFSMNKFRPGDTATMGGPSR